MTETRQQRVCRYADEGYRVGEIAAAMELSRPYVSRVLLVAHHLGLRPHDRDVSAHTVIGWVVREIVAGTDVEVIASAVGWRVSSVQSLGTIIRGLGGEYRRRPTLADAVRGLLSAGAKVDSAALALEWGTTPGTVRATATAVRRAG